MRYRRAWMPGGIYFFTLVTHDRQPILTTPANRQRLGRAFRHVRASHPFGLDGVVVLPDHIHCLMALPARDSDFALRIRLIKSFFSRMSDPEANHSSSARAQRGEKRVWQRRYWEHLVRSQADWRRHLDYLHYNPVKHGYADRVRDWRWSSWHRYYRAGAYSPDWGEGEPRDIRGMCFE